MIWTNQGLAPQWASKCTVVDAAPPACLLLSAATCSLAHLAPFLEGVIKARRRRRRRSNCSWWGRGGQAGKWMEPLDPRPACLVPHPSHTVIILRMESFHCRGSWRKGEEKASWSEAAACLFASGGVQFFSVTVNNKMLNLSLSFVGWEDLRQWVTFIAGRVERGDSWNVKQLVLESWTTTASLLVGWRWGAGGIYSFGSDTMMGRVGGPITFSQWGRKAFSWNSPLPISCHVHYLVPPGRSGVGNVWLKISFPESEKEWWGHGMRILLQKHFPRRHFAHAERNSSNCEMYYFAMGNPPRTNFFILL